MENKLYWLYFFNRKIELQIRDSRLDWKQKWWPTWPKNDFSPKRVERECLLLWPSLLLLLSFCLNMNLLGGSFNNYVDQILHIFDHLPQVDNCGSFTWNLSFIHVTMHGLSTEHLATSSCPRRFWMTPWEKNGWRFSKEIPHTHTFTLSKWKIC